MIPPIPSSFTPATPTRTPRLLVALVMAAMFIVVPANAKAAETYNAPRTEVCGVDRGSGMADTNGVLYAACGARIVRFSATGARMDDVTIPGSSFFAVVPYQGGKYLFVSTGGRLKRLDQQTNGTYKISTTWAPENYILGGKSWKPVARNLTGDDFGNIYVSNNGIDPETRVQAPNRIIKYSPAGKVLTQFGEHGDVPNDPYSFYQNRGLGVSRDGRNLWVTSHLSGEVRRFDLQPNGEYRYLRKIGTTNTSCDTNAGLAAPSDVKVDPWGFVYVTDTSCGKVKKFSPTGAWIATIGTKAGSRVHEIAVNRRGDVYVGEWDRLYLRAASNPLPGALPAITQPVIDLTAPVLTKVTAPATTTTAAIKIAITATDNVAITEARVANEDGTWGAWKAFTNPLAHTLTAGATYKTITVQVRDAGGNESAMLTTSTRVLAAGEPAGEPAPVVPGAPTDTVDPTLTKITIAPSFPTSAATIAITATDNVKVTQVRVANEDGTWGGWKTFATPLAHTLSPGATSKLVFVQVRDAAGNESKALTATTRVLAAGEAAPIVVAPGTPADTTAPVLTGATLPATTATRTISIKLTATDAVGVAQVRTANEDGTFGAWRAYSTTVTHTLTAVPAGSTLVRGVFIQVRDAAGNESTTLYRTLLSSGA